MQIRNLLILALIFSWMLTLLNQPTPRLPVLKQMPAQAPSQVSPPLTLPIPASTADELLPNNLAVNPVLSADGNLVVFASRATNLIPSETTDSTSDDPRFDFWQIYAYDRAQERVERISVTPGGQAGNANSGGSPPALSADGRFVAFASRATNLVVGDSNNASDIFVRDRQTGQTSRVSVPTGGGQGNRDSYLPTLSADGRFVAFVSQATNLVTGDSNNVADVFVHDRQTGTTRRISVATNGAQANASSGLAAPSLSADGRFVAFASQATNLVAGDSNNVADVFVHDRQTGTTRRISVAANGTQANGPSTAPALAANGRYVAFLSAATNLVADPRNSQNNSQTHVYLHDRQSGTTERVSIGHDGALANGESYAPVISADGRFVAFASAADNLVAANPSGNQTLQVYLHDGLSGQIERVSLTSTGDPANGLAWRPALGDYGRYIAFESTAANLTGSNAETGGISHIYLRDRGPQATGAHTLGGRILGPNNTPVADQVVTVGRRFPRQAVSDREGRFAVPNLPAGTYVVDLDAPDALVQPEFPLVVSVDETTDPAQALQVRIYPCRAPSGLDLCTLRPGDILLALTPDGADWPQAGGTYFTQASLYTGLIETDSSPGSLPSSQASLQTGPHVVQVRSELADNGTDSSTANDTAWRIDRVELTETTLWSGANVLDWAVVRPQVSAEVSATLAQRAADFGRSIAVDPATRYAFFAENDNGDTPVALADPHLHYDAKLIAHAYAQAGYALEPGEPPVQPGLTGWITPDDLYRASLASGATSGAEVQRRAFERHERAFFVWAQGPVRVALVGANGVRMGYRPSQTATLAPLGYLYSGEGARVESIAVGQLAGDVEWHMEITGVAAGNFVVGRRTIAPGTADPATHTIEAGTIDAGETQRVPLAELERADSTLYLPAIMR